MTMLRNLYLTDEDTGYTAGLDDMTAAVNVIDYAHHEIHGGSMFSAMAYVAAAASASISFKTPAGTKRAHMLLEFTSESKAHVIVAEGATWTTNTGTVYVPVNQKRLASPAASMLLEDKTATPAYTANGVLVDATADAAGTAISTHYVFGIKQSGGLGGVAREELILKPDETYAVTLTSDDGNKGLQLRLLWYEHTDKA